MKTMVPGSANRAMAFMSAFKKSPEIERYIASSVIQIVAPKKSPMTPPSTAFPYKPAKTAESVAHIKTCTADCCGKPSIAITTPEKIQKHTLAQPSTRVESPNQL